MNKAYFWGYTVYFCLTSSVIRSFSITLASASFRPLTTDFLTAEGVRYNAQATSAPEYPNRSIVRTQKIDPVRETFLRLPGKGHMLESRLKYPAHIFNDSPHRVVVDIANQLQQMSTTCEQSSHDSGNGDHASSKKNGRDQLSTPMQNRQYRCLQESYSTGQ